MEAECLGVPGYYKISELLQLANANLSKCLSFKECLRRGVQTGQRAKAGGLSVQLLNGGSSPFGQDAVLF